jgi:hypothetical protein
MNEMATTYNRGAVRPVQCLKEGWGLVKDDYFLFLGITIVGLLVGSAVPFGILLGPMWCGIDICLFRRMRGQRPRFGDLFEGFQYFGPSLLATVAVIVPMIFLILLVVGVFLGALFALVLPMAQQGGPPDATFFVALFGLIALYIVALTVVSVAGSVPLIFMYPLIVERRLTGLGAVMTSVKAALANLWGLLGLVLLITLLGMAGSLLLFVGAYLLLPITFAAYAVAYRQAFPPLGPGDEFPEDRETADGSAADVPAEPARDPAGPTDIAAGPPPE